MQVFESAASLDTCTSHAVHTSCASALPVYMAAKMKSKTSHHSHRMCVSPVSVCACINAKRFMSYTVKLDM